MQDAEVRDAEVEDDGGDGDKEDDTEEVETVEVADGQETLSDSACMGTAQRPSEAGNLQ